MNTREKFSAILLCFGLLLALIPLSANRSFSIKPQKLLSEVLDETTYLTVDQVARFIVAEDSLIQIIDLRSPEEYMKVNIPGSINISYEQFINNDPGRFLSNVNIKSVLYSNGDMESNYALVIAKGLNYDNIFVMKGGLNEWINTIMNSQFTGERISARENAIFETRTRAKRLFTEINSLPDSLKIKYMESRIIAEKNLDGGCE